MRLFFAFLCVFCFTIHQYQPHNFNCLFIKHFYNPIIMDITSQVHDIVHFLKLIYIFFSYEQEPCIPCFLPMQNNKSSCLSLITHSKYISKLLLTRTVFMLWNLWPFRNNLYFRFNSILIQLPGHSNNIFLIHNVHLFHYL